MVQKQGQQIYIIELEKSSIDGLLKRDLGYVWLMKQILSESERVIRFRSLRSSTTFASFISFSHRQYEKCFHPLICDSNQFWIGDAIWKFRKILNLIISQRIRPPVLKRPDESAVSVLIKKLNITKTGTPVFFCFFQVRGNRSMITLHVCCGSQ